MRKVLVGEWLLSLVTDEGRAGALAGDLAEESAARGSFWFWISLTGTCLALLWTSFASHSGTLLGRSVVVFAIQLLTAICLGPVFAMLSWLKIPLAQIWFGLWVVPAGAVWASGHWLARRSEGEELAASVMCIGVGYLVSAVVLAIFDRIDWPGFDLMNLAILPVAIYVRRQRVRSAHA